MSLHTVCVMQYITGHLYYNLLSVCICKMVVSYTDWKNHMLFKRLRLEKLYVIVLITIQRVSAHAFAVAKAQKF